MGVQSHLERHRKQLNLFIRIYVLSFYLLHPLLGRPLEVVCDEGFSKSPARLYSCRSIIVTKYDTCFVFALCEDYWGAILPGRRRHAGLEG